MTHCRRVFGPNERRPHYVCDFCDSLAVFHWRSTYPDLLLCAECLTLYPEAQEPACDHDSTLDRWNERSE